MIFIWKWNKLASVKEMNVTHDRWLIVQKKSGSTTSTYRLWRLWCKLLYLVFVIYLVLDFRSVKLFLLNWYLCISGTSSFVVLFISKSLGLDSSIFNFASIAWIVISLLNFCGSFDEDPAASTGIEILGLGFSKSS